MSKKIKYLEDICIELTNIKCECGNNLWNIEGHSIKGASLCSKCNIIKTDMPYSTEIADDLLCQMIEQEMIENYYTADNEKNKIEIMAKILGNNKLITDEQ